MRELGEKAQITPGMVSRYENGKADPSKRILKRLSIAFQVPLSELTSELASSEPIVKITTEELELVRRISKLKPQDRGCVKMLIESLSDLTEWQNKVSDSMPK